MSFDGTKLILILIIISIIILYIIWISFGDSLKNVQYFCTKYLYLDYGDGSNNFLNALKWCTLNCILFSNRHFFEYLIHDAKILYDDNGIPAGFYKRDGKQLIISFVSTANLDHVKTATKNSVNIFGFHTGYYDRIESLLKKYIYDLENIEEIILCGHSMAGAMAGLASYLLSYRFPFSKIYVYSFGSPKFCTDIPIWKSNIEYFDFTNTADPVTFKPLNNEYIRLSSNQLNGEFISRYLDTGNDNVNHSIKVYREVALKKEITSFPRRPHRADEIISRWFLDMLG
jgi:hypothetical protein